MKQEAIGYLILKLTSDGDWDDYVSADAKKEAEAIWEQLSEMKDDNERLNYLLDMLLQETISVDLTQ